MGLSARRLMRLGIVVGAIALTMTSPRPTQAKVTCPARSAAMPVVSWLVDHIDSVTVHHLTSQNDSLVEVDGYPKTSTDPAFINAVLSLTGSYVPWNGYDSPSPFGSFYYPRWGNWYAEYELRTSQEVYYAWMWRSARYNRERLLVFTFSDMETGTDS